MVSCFPFFPPSVHPSTHQPICLSISHALIHPPIHLSIHLSSIHSTIHLPFHQSVHPSVHQFIIHPPTHPSTHPSVCPPIHSSTHPPICPSIHHPSTHQSICSSTHASIPPSMPVDSACSVPTAVSGPGLVGGHSSTLWQGLCGGWGPGSTHRSKATGCQGTGGEDGLPEACPWAAGLEAVL